MKKMTKTEKIVEGNRKRAKGVKNALRKHRADAIRILERNIVMRKRVAARKLAELLGGMTPEGRRAYQMHLDMMKAGAGA